MRSVSGDWLLIITLRFTTRIMELFHWTAGSRDLLVDTFIAVDESFMNLNTMKGSD